MVGKEFEQRGIIKDGAKMINAVTNSRVPHLTIHMAASYGAGNYGMCGRAFGPRFLFAWPNAKTRGDGSATACRRDVDRRQAVGGVAWAGRSTRKPMRRCDDRSKSRSNASRWPLFMTGKVYDDGIIDPRDTRTVLGMCLSVIDNQPDRGHPRLRRVPDVTP